MKLILAIIISILPTMILAGPVTLFSINVPGFEEITPKVNVLDMKEIFSRAPAASRQLSSDPRTCLAQALYHEARGEDPDGQVAVLTIINNRANAKRWKSTVCEIIGQKHAFSFVKPGGRIPATKEIAAWNKVWFIAGLYQDGMPALGRIDHYHSTSVRPDWSKSPKLVRTTKIGRHIFYIDKTTRW